MKVLIIEDNQLVAKTLVKNLQPYYMVSHESNGHDGRYAALTKKHDIILLDLNLPDITGEEVFRSVRATGLDTPILVISGRDDVRDRIALLNMGADDYLVKPFNLEELRARIEVAIRRISNKAIGGVLAIDDLVLNPHNRTVEHYGADIQLRRKEFDLLTYLMHNQGQVLTRTMILERIWNRDEVLWANVIDVHIKHLRDKVDRPFGTNLIQTAHGLGYKVESAYPNCDKSLTATKDN